LTASTRENPNVKKNEFRPTAIHRLTAAEFARLSSSLQLALLVIRRAQLSSREAVDALSKRKKLYGQ
jgi:hypothetical protein